MPGARGSDPSPLPLSAGSIRCAGIRLVPVVALFPLLVAKLPPAIAQILAGIPILQKFWRMSSYPQKPLRSAPL